MKRYSFIAITLILSIFVCSLTFADTIELPTVVMLGTPAYLEYYKESEVWGDKTIEFSEETREIADDNIVQIGDIPILSVEDLKYAYSFYDDQYILVTTIRNNEITRKLRYISENEVDLEKYTDKATTNGILSFYDPNLNLAFSLGQPISNDKVLGDIIKAKVTGRDGNALTFEKEQKGKKDVILGKIEGQTSNGVLFSYFSGKTSFKNYKKLEIARKDTVETGKAFIYANFGKGVKKYEISILSLDETSSEENMLSFVVTDSNLVAKGLNLPLTGMNGAPIIQNGKIVAIYSYADDSCGYAIFAEDAYLSMLNWQKSKNARLSVTSIDNHPIVYSNHFDITLCLKTHANSRMEKTYETSYVSMVSPSNYKFATVSSYDDSISVDSGLVIKGQYVPNDENKITTSSVVGSITEQKTILYGYISPLYFKTVEYTQIAFKEEITDGSAYISCLLDGSQVRIPVIIKKCDDHLEMSLDGNMSIFTSFDEIPFKGMPVIQNDRMVGVYKKAQNNTAIGYYAIDVYNEMMNTGK